MKNLLLILAITSLILVTISCSENQVVNNSNNSTSVKDYTYYIPFNNSSIELKTSLIPTINIPITYISDRNNIANNAAYLNGSQFLEYKGDDAMNLQNSFSISCWLKPDKDFGTTSAELQNEIQVLGRFEGQSINTSSYALNLLNDGKVSLRLFSNNQKNSFFTTETKLTPEKWSNVIVIYNQTNVQIYINGKLELNNSNSNNAQNSNISLCVGARNFPSLATNRFYKGGLDDLIIFKRTLTDIEILTLSK